ncbi:MAG: KOW motif-containing protein [Pseudobdellovibrionaceae bacterium]|jgi:large subunit ribosomal protein L24
MAKLKIKQGATVQVITGSDKGKKGKVLALDKNKLKIKVEGVRVQTHYDKKEGLLKKEGFIDYSNVKLVDNVVVEKKKKTSKKAATKEKSA